MDHSIEEEMDVYYRTLEERADIGWFLQGHLVVEYMLKKRLREGGFMTDHEMDRSGFYTIASKSLEHQIINSDQKEVLLAINGIRNSYAHELDYSPQLSEWIHLWEKAKAAFNDITDGIEQGLSELKTVEKIEDAERLHVNELFVQICHDI